MIKRVFISVLLLMCLCLPAMANNKELSIKLDSKESCQTENLSFVYLTFEYMNPNGYDPKVRVIVENITQNPPYAILMFRNDKRAQELKKGKPKIEFVKTYPGDKNSRKVIGCREINQNVDIILAANTDTIFTIDASFTSPKDITLPLYVAKYKAKDLKKGKNNINYTILEEHIYDIHIQVVGWTKEDPTYVSVKKGVESFVSSLKDVTFCDNKKHKPSWEEQQRPYQEKKDSLINVIDKILETHSEWMTIDAPHIAYSDLKNELKSINLNKMLVDCGKHERPIPSGHSCSYCSLSTQDIYQRLDDLYQQLYAGKISKEQAVKTAKGLYNCYQQYKKRKKDSSYGAKISRFYNSIVNY